MKPSARRQAPAVEVLRPRAQELKIVHAVALKQETRSYRVIYLEIPESELAKYAVGSEVQDLAIAEAKMAVHFRKAVVKL